MQDKSTIRREVKHKILSMPVASRQVADAALLQGLQDILRSHREYKDRMIMAYIPLPDEPNISPCFDWFGGLCLPQMLPGGQMCAREIGDWRNDCVPGDFGVMEPGEGLPLVEPDQIAMVIVPGRAFTREGKRLGRGKGFYDRFLVQCSGSTLKVALCYNCQMYSDIPCQYHDLPVDVVIAR